MPLSSVSSARETRSSIPSRGFSPVNVQVQPANKRAERSQQVQQAQKSQQSNRGYQPGNKQIERANQKFQQSANQGQSSSRQYEPTGQKAASSGKKLSPLNEARQLSQTAKAPASISPLPTAESPRFPEAQRAPRIPSASRSLLPSSIGRVMSPLRGEGQLTTALAIKVSRDYLESNGWSGYTGLNPEENRRIAQNDAAFLDAYHRIPQSIANGIGDTFNKLGNALKDVSRSSVGDRLADLLNLFPNPYKNKPRTDPKNDDSRPKPQRYTYEWTGIKFWSPGNNEYVTIGVYKGQYQLEKFYGHPISHEYKFPDQNGDADHGGIYWDNLNRVYDKYTVTRASTNVEFSTIEPDPTYMPPSYELPVLQPGNPFDPGYPPVFTEDDFKPQKQRNDDAARQDEADRQSDPLPEQQREEALDQQRRFAPDPWNDPLPIPAESPTPQPEPIQAPKPYPYPYPLDFPSIDPDQSPSDFPSPDPTAPPSERLREKIERLKRKLDERFPQPSNEPQTQVTINGKPVPRPNSSPPQRLIEPINDNEPYVTINGSPVPRTSTSPLPDTRTQSPTTTTTTTTTTTPTTPNTTTTTTPKLPVEPIIDPTTGLPLPSGDPTTTTTTPDKCKDPCIQGLNDKVDEQNKTEIIEFKVFKECDKDKGEAIYITSSLPIPKIISAIVKSTLNTIAESQGKQCELDKHECYTAIPDWWQIRLGADVPQAIVQYAEIKADGKFGAPKYVISIPHYSRTKETTAVTDFPTYTKGQKMGILTLSDNSKLIVNAKDSSELELVIGKLKLTIDANRLDGSVYSDGTRKGTNLQQIQVAPRSVKYFPTGQKDTKPAWIKNFSDS